MDGDSIPDLFWNLSAAYYAYLYAGLSRQGIEIVGESTLCSDPGDWPEASLVYWKTGKPNARYLILDLIRENLDPGDLLLTTEVKTEDQENPVFALGFISDLGVCKIQLVNKISRADHIAGPGHMEINACFVDFGTGIDPLAEIVLHNKPITLKGFGVAFRILSE